MSVKNQGLAQVAVEYAETVTQDQPGQNRLTADPLCCAVLCSYPAEVKHGSLQL